MNFANVACTGINHIILIVIIIIIKTVPKLRRVTRGNRIKHAEGNSVFLRIKLSSNNNRHDSFRSASATSDVYIYN